MIHDARVEITCDGENCHESIMVQPDYVYTSQSGAGGHYDCRESAIEKKLLREGWGVRDGKHYCEDCKPHGKAS